MANTHQQPGCMLRKFCVEFVRLRPAGQLRQRLPLGFFFSKAEYASRSEIILPGSLSKYFALLQLFPIPSPPVCEVLNRIKASLIGGTKSLLLCSHLYSGVFPPVRTMSHQL